MLSLILLGPSTNVFSPRPKDLITTLPTPTANPSLTFTITTVSCFTYYPRLHRG